MGNLTNKLCFLMVIIEVSPIVLSFRTISYLDCMCFFHHRSEAWVTFRFIHMIESDLNG